MGTDARDVICGMVSNSGPNGEPLACAYRPHDGEQPHSWATLPTFTQATGDEPLDGGVRIPRNPAKRRTLAQAIGLTDEEERALNEWVASQADENRRRQRRGWEQSANDVLGAPSPPSSTEGGGQP